MNIFSLFVIIVIISITSNSFGKYLILEADNLIWDIHSEEITSKRVQAKYDYIFCKAKEVKISKGEVLSLSNGYLTTCNLINNPHYKFSVKSLRLTPEKLIAKHLVLRILNIPVFYFPIYVHYLDDKRPKFAITCGYKEKNFYSQIKYNYFLSKNFLGNLFIDLIPKRGYGIGISHEGKLFKEPLEISSYFFKEKTKERYNASFKYNPKFNNLQNVISLNLASDSAVKRDYGYELHKFDKLKSVVNSTLNTENSIISFLIEREDEVFKEKFIKHKEILPMISYRLKLKRLKKLPIYREFEINLANRYNLKDKKNTLQIDSLLKIFNYMRFRNLLIKPQSIINYNNNTLQFINSILTSYMYNNLKLDLDYNFYNKRLNFILVKSFKDTKIYGNYDYSTEDGKVKEISLNLRRRNLQLCTAFVSKRYSLFFFPKDLSITATWVKDNLNFILSKTFKRFNFEIFYDLTNNKLNFINLGLNLDLHCFEGKLIMQKKLGVYNYYFKLNIKKF